MDASEDYANTKDTRPVVRTHAHTDTAHTHPHTQSVQVYDNNNNNAQSDQYLRTHKMRFVFAHQMLSTKYTKRVNMRQQASHEKMIRMIRKFVRCSENATVRGKILLQMHHSLQNLFAVRIAQPLAMTSQIYYEENTIREYK